MEPTSFKPEPPRQVMMRAVKAIKSKKGASLFATLQLADDNINKNDNFFKKAQEKKVEV